MYRRLLIASHSFLPWTHLHKTITSYWCYRKSNIHVGKIIDIVYYTYIVEWLSGFFIDINTTIVLLTTWHFGIWWLIFDDWPSVYMKHKQWKSLDTVFSGHVQATKVLVVTQLISKMQNMILSGKETELCGFEKSQKWESNLHWDICHSVPKCKEDHKFEIHEVILERKVLQKATAKQQPPETTSITWVYVEWFNFFNAAGTICVNVKKTTHAQLSLTKVKNMTWELYMKLQKWGETMSYMYTIFTL